MTPVQWLAVALTVAATHAACFFLGLECARRVIRQAVYDLGYQDGVDNRHRRPSSVDATVGPTRLRTVPGSGMEP